MSRKKRHSQRQQIADPIYKSLHLSKFINKVMLDGKKSTAQRSVYDALVKAGQEVDDEPLEAFNKALKNVMPLMEVKSRRVGGSNYQVPVEVKVDRGIALAMRWIIGNARSKSGRSFSVNLAQEIIDAYNNSGASVKKKEDTHKMADANKAFAHFRW